MQAKHYLTGFLILAGITFLIFAKSIPYEFVEWDDGFFIYENDIIMEFNAENLRSMFLDQHYGIYTPVLWLSLAIDYHFYGLESWGYRLSNLLFHIINIGLVMYLFRYFIDTRKYELKHVFIATVVAILLWGIHPLRVESVVWASQRRDVLSAFFCLLSLICYMQYSRKFASKLSHLYREKNDEQDWKYLLSIFFYFLALLAKPSVVPFPIVLIMVDIYPLKKYRFDLTVLPRLLSSCIDKWAYFLMGGCAALLTLFSHGYIKGIYPLSQLSLEHRFSNAVYCLAMYLVDTVIPLTLQPYYKKQNLTFFDPLILLSLIFYAIVFIFLIRLAVKKKIYWGISILGTYCAMLFPILGFFQAGSGGAGNRFTYLATIPLFFLLGALILKYFNKKWIWWCLAIWGTALAAKNISQQNIWKDSESYFTYMIEKEPKSPASTYNKLAAIKANKGEAIKALNIYDDALRTHGTPEQWSNSFNGIGNIYFQANNFVKAEFFYRQAISSYPEGHLAQNNLGNVHVKNDAFEAAEQMYKEAIQNNRKYTGAYYNLGLLYRLQKRLEEAKQYIAAAGILSPEDADIQEMLRTIEAELSE